MPPAKKPVDREVTVTVFNVTVHYAEGCGYQWQHDLLPEESVKVIDFTETWQNEQGILTLAVVTNG